MKRAITAQIEAISAFMAQCGAKLTDAARQALDTVLASLNAMLAQAEEPEIGALISASMPLANLLGQETVTGRTWDGSYEELLAKLNRALYSSSDIPGSYKYAVWTWPGQVVVFSESYDNGKWKTAYYLVDWTRNGDEFTFSNVQEADIKQIVVLLQSSFTQNGLFVQEDAVPLGMSYERGEDDPYLVQQVRADIRVLGQGTAGKGTVRFGGTATVADVVNSYGQVYPLQLWQNQVSALQERVLNGRLVGASGHKETSTGAPRLPEPHEVSHVIQSLSMDGNKVKFEAETTTTQAGKDLAAALTSGVGLDMSTLAAAKAKAGKWQGQKVSIIQEDGFYLATIDAVLNGASPGSTVDYARLQAKKSEPKPEDQAMDRDEILKLIQEAIAQNDGAKLADLQAQLEDLKKSLGQSAQPELSEADKTLLAQAAEVVAADNRRKAVEARNAKVSEVVDKLIQDKELPTLLKQSAENILKSIASTAEEVDGKLDEFKGLMAPMVEQHKLLQSKGMYAPEYNDDGTKRDAPQSYHDAIERIMTSGIERGLVQDNGREDFTNTARSLRIMLQNIAREKPFIVDAYLLYQNKQFGQAHDVHDWLMRNRMSVLRQSGMLTQDIPAGAMTTDDVAAAVPFVFPLVMEVWPQLIAWQLGTVQPLERSTGRIYYWHTKDENDNDMNDVANFTGSYANDPGEKQTIKKLKGSIDSEDVTCEIKKLGYDLSVEVMRHLRTDFGIDATGTLLASCGNEIAREWNYQILQDMLDGAGAGNVNYGTAVPADGSYDGPQWKEAIMDHVDRASDLIYDYRFADSQWVIGESQQISRITGLAKRAGLYSGDGAGRISDGVDIVGTVNGRQKLVKVGWWNTLAPNKLLVGAKGSQWPQTGYVIAPYLGLFVTPIWIDPETMDVMQSLMSELARKMVDGKYFATITIQEGVAGTPL